MFKEQSTKIIWVDPVQAKEFLKLNTFEGQRKINPRHVKKLEKEIMDGTFRVAEIATAVEHFNGRNKVLMNGQQTCTAIINTGKKVKALYEVYDTFTPSDVSLLFRKFDNNFVRTLGQKALVEARSLGINWPFKTISLVTTGIRYYLGYDSKQDLVVDEFKRFTKVGDFMNRLFTEIEPQPKHLMRGPVAHAMMLTWDKSQSDSAAFWTQVRDGEGLRRSDPAKVLRDFLMSKKVAFGKGTADYKPVSMHEMTAKCITAWNAFRKNTKTDLKYYSNKPIPKAI